MVFFPSPGFPGNHTEFLCFLFLRISLVVIRFHAIISEGWGWRVPCLVFYCHALALADHAKMLLAYPFLRALLEEGSCVRLFFSAIKGFPRTSTQFLSQLSNIIIIQTRIYQVSLFFHFFSSNSSEKLPKICQFKQKTYQNSIIIKFHEFLPNYSVAIFMARFSSLFGNPQ